MNTALFVLEKGPDMNRCEYYTLMPRRIPIPLIVVSNKGCRSPESRFSKKKY
jgi:hypothetical protein